MFRRVMLLLALPLAGAAAQSTDLTVEITTPNNAAFRIVRTPADTTAPALFAGGHAVIHYKVPLTPKMFTVVPVDSSVFVSVVVTRNNQTVLSGTGAYVRIQTDADQKVHLEAGAGRPTYPPSSDSRDGGSLVLYRMIPGGEWGIATEHKLGSRPQ